MRFSRDVPEHFQFGFEEYLFNTIQHRKTQSETGWQSFYLLDDKKKIILASWHLHIDDNLVRSPYKATFGGIDFSNAISLEDLSNFVKEVIRNFADPIEVVLAPQTLHPMKFAIASQALIDSGLSISKSQISAIIHVRGVSFEKIIHKSEKKKLNRAIKAGLVSKKLELSFFDDVYGHIFKCRQERGQSLSMSIEQLRQVVNAMPDNIQLFGVYDNKDMAASAITLRVSSEVLYVFYGGHSKEYDAISPAVMLHACMYEHCYENDIRFLDLGTSSTKNGTDYNLLNFKQYIGAEPGLKFTFTRH